MQFSFESFDLKSGIQCTGFRFPLYFHKRVSRILFRWGGGVCLSARWDTHPHSGQTPTPPPPPRRPLHRTVRILLEMLSCTEYFHQFKFFNIGTLDYSHISLLWPFLLLFWNLTRVRNFEGIEMIIWPNMYTWRHFPQQQVDFIKYWILEKNQTFYWDYCFLTGL